MTLAIGGKQSVCCCRHSYFDVTFSVNDAIMRRSYHVEAVFVCRLISTNENMDTQNLATYLEVKPLVLLVFYWPAH